MFDKDRGQEDCRASSRIREFFGTFTGCGSFFASLAWVSMSALRDPSEPELHNIAATCSFKVPCRKLSFTWLPFF